MIKNIIDTSKKYLTKLGFTSLSQQFLEYINDGKIQEALTLVESGVDIKIASFGNTTALMSVCSRNYEIFKNSQLLSDATKEHKKTYFDLFYCMINSKKITLAHLNEQDDDGNTAIHYTVAFKNI